MKNGQLALLRPVPRLHVSVPWQPLAGVELQHRLEDLELATVSVIRALQMDVDGEVGVPSAAVLRKARQANR